MNRLLLSIIISVVSLCGYCANNLKEARAFYLKGEYEKALPLFQKAYKKKPKDGSINHWLGVCLYETGRAKDAIKYLEYADTRKVIESSHYLAKIFISEYDFQRGIEMYDRYLELLEKSNKKMSDRDELELKKAKLAKPMLEHVEKIAVIDSLLVDKETFFKYYQISPESGSINSTAILPFEVACETTVYCNQGEDRMLWAMPDESGMMKICESAKLIDGSWDTPQFISGDLNDGGNLNYPFLLQDGATLYYASNGEGSIGGYDIFVTRKDTDTGTYMRPQNVGMPYNSQADDYLMVLDDMTGLGWWATDRNKIEDKITIYVFVKNDIRENYDESEENLVSYAKISDYRATWHGEDYFEMVNDLRNVETNTAHSEEEFVFNVKKGVIYTSYTDFKSDEASEMMGTLIDLYGNLRKCKTALKLKRELYNKSGIIEKERIKPGILDLEKELEALRLEVFKTENNIRRLEQNN